ncbi:hypothetical protein WN943_021140 [Citrus x changshan-huyou]
MISSYPDLDERAIREPSCPGATTDRQGNVISYLMYLNIFNDDKKLRSDSSDLGESNGAGGDLPRAAMAADRAPKAASFPSGRSSTIQPSQVTSDVRSRTQLEVCPNFGEIENDGDGFMAVNFRASNSGVPFVFRQRGRLGYDGRLPSFRSIPSSAGEVAGITRSVRVKCGSDCNGCRMYPDLSFYESPTTTTKILVLGDAYAKMHHEVSEMGFGTEGEAQNQRQEMRQCPRQFAARARILIEEGFLNVRVSRVRAANLEKQNR